MTSEVFTQDELSGVSMERTESFSLTTGELEESLHKVRAKVANLVTEFCIFKREFEHERIENTKWKKGIDEKLDLILGLLNHCQSSSVVESQSLLLDGIPMFEKPKVPPFVTIKYPDGSVEDIVLNEKDARDIMSGSSQREIVQKLLLLLHGHDIALLRTFSLTGKSSGRKRSWKDTEDLLRLVNQDSQDVVEDESSSLKKPLPLRTVLVIQATIKKLHPVHPTLFDINPQLAAKEVEKLEQDVRGYITAVLNYFSWKYDANGKMIVSPKAENPSKKPRRILQDSQQNNEHN